MAVSQNNTDRRVASTTRRGWIKCKGNGRPVPIGTLVHVRLFCGVEKTILAGMAEPHDANGRPLARGEVSICYNAWDFGDGGDMSAKFKAYRVITAAKTVARNATMFTSWLDVREMEAA